MAQGKGSITNFINAIGSNGGMSMSNGYDIEFDFSSVKEAYTGNTLLTDLAKFNIRVPVVTTNPGEPGALINLFCDEVQLPSNQSATGQLTGRYLGEGPISYPHTKLVSDFSLSWICDANMAPYKFLMTWYNYIFNAGSRSNTIIELSADRLKNTKADAKPKSLNRPVRLNYPNSYQATLKISKAEKGKNAPNSRVPLVYVIEDCYPYSIDAIPLSYGTSQLVKATANFYYSKYSVYFADIRKYEG